MHRQICKRYVTFLAQVRRPSHLARLGLFLPDTQGIPYPTWIEFDQVTEVTVPATDDANSEAAEYVYPAGIPQVEDYVDAGFENMNLAYTAIQRDHWWETRPLPDGLLACFHDKRAPVQGRGLCTNLCLWRLITARRVDVAKYRSASQMMKDEDATLPRGPVVIVAQMGLTTGEGYRDVRAGDLTQVANFFRCFRGDWDTFDPFCPKYKTAASSDSGDDAYVLARNVGEIDDKAAEGPSEPSMKQGGEPYLETHTPEEEAAEMEEPDLLALDDDERQAQKPRDKENVRHAVHTPSGLSKEL